MKIEYTNHAEKALTKRKISKDEIEIAVKSPDKLTKINKKYYAQKNIVRGNIEVVYERENYIKVITVYWL